MTQWTGYDGDYAREAPRGSYRLVETEDRRFTVTTPEGKERYFISESDACTFVDQQLIGKTVPNWWRFSEAFVFSLSTVAARRRLGR